MRTLVGQIANAVTRRTKTPVPYTSSRGDIFNTAYEGTIGDRAYDAHGSVGTLFAIINQLSSAFASIEWHLYRKTQARDENRRKEVTNHAITTLWNTPNPFYTGRLFRETVQQHLDLVGEGVIVLVNFGKLPVEMWPVRPDRIKPVKHETKFLIGYIYEGPDGEQVPLTLDQVIHIKMPNPADPYRGRGPVQSVLADLDASRYSADWNRNFFINGARPGGVIEVDHRMSDNEWNEFVGRWRRQHQGVANAHRVAVLENGKWIDTKFSMQDMQFVELRNLPRELIREAFAFPKAMLGTVDDVNRANSDAGETIFGRWQVDPRCARWKDIVNVKLVPRFQSGQSLELDYDNPVPMDREAEDRQRASQTRGAKDLVLAGYHHKDVAQAMGLPEMRWTGIPKAPKEESDESSNGNENQSTN